MHIKKLSVAVILGLAALSATPTRAADVFWTGASSEFWTNGANWFSLSQPTTTDSARFQAGDFFVLRSDVVLSADRTVNFFSVTGDNISAGPYSFRRIDGAKLTVFGGTQLGFTSATSPSTTTLNGFLMQTNTLRVLGRMTAVITGSADITTTGAMTLNDSAVLNLNGGSLSLAGAGAVHQIRSGTMNVNGGTLNLSENAELGLLSDTSKLNFSSGFNIVNNAQISVLVGSDVVGESYIDVGNGGPGRLSVNGTGSTFTAQSSTSDWGRGATGNANVLIRTGGAATVAFLRVGTVDAQAALIVADGGTLTVNNDFEAGGGTTLRTVQLSSQSSGTMTFNGAAVFNNQADLDLTSGTVNFNQNATFNAGSRFDRTGGTLNIASGKKLIINDGVYEDTAGGQVLPDGVGVEVRGGAGRFNVSNFFDIGNGSLLVENGGQYNSPAGATTTDWAQNPGREMTATVRNSGLIDMGALRIAQNGRATVNVQSNGRLETNALTVGGSSTSAAQITLNGGFVTVFGSATLGQGARMDLNDPAGSNTGQFTRFLVDGTLNMSGSAIIFTTGENPVISVDALNMTSPSQIVLRRGAELLITYGATAAPLSTIRGYVGSARLFSDAITTDPRLAVGYVDFPDPQFGSMTIKVTLLGDATLDGTVNFDDLLVLAANYNGTGKHWFQGDSTYDGAVNFDDLLKLASNYNQTLTGSLGGDWALAQSLVPEPALLGSAIPACAGLLTRRRRRAAQ